MLIKKVDCLLVRFMQLLIALCQEQNTEIVSLQDYGRDKQLVAEVELPRQEANRMTPSIINKALEASKESWDGQANKNDSRR